MRAEPLGLGELHRCRPDGAQPVRLGLITQVVRLRKSKTDSPEANRLLRPVGSTWFGPAT
jgi:hypothetical protein